MKTYRLVLASFGPVFVEADSIVENQRTLAFIKGGHVCAEYARRMVKSYAEAGRSMPPAAEPGWPDHVQIIHASRLLTNVPSPSPRAQ